MSNPDPARGATAPHWLPEEDEILRRLWLAGGQSAYEIGDGMHPKRSRSSILGRVRRLGIQRPLSAQPNSRAVPRAEVIIRRARAVHVNIPPAPVAKLSVPRPWESRKFGECAFPLDRAGETYSCCAPVKAERNYCKAHCKIMYVSTPPMGAKRQKAA